MSEGTKPIDMAELHRDVEALKARVAELERELNLIRKLPRRPEPHWQGV